MKIPTHIAVLDDEVSITEMLAFYLHGHGYRVTQVHDGSALLALMEGDRPALVLLDLGLPGEDGLTIARELRQRWRCGLAIVTGRGDAVDKVVGLELGADDYITKPFDLRELAARIKAILRRILPPESEGLMTGSSLTDGKLCFDGWELDTDARRLTDPGRAEVPLTGGEFDLLNVFARHSGRVLSRDFLLGQLHGRDGGPFDRTIDVQVSRLRRKIETDPDNPQRIKSVRGAGYILVPAVTRK